MYQICQLQRPHAPDELSLQRLRHRLRVGVLQNRLRGEPDHADHLQPLTAAVGTMALDSVSQTPVWASTSSSCLM